VVVNSSSILTQNTKERLLTKDTSGSCSTNPTPKFPHQLSNNDQIKNQKKKKKNSIEVQIVNNQIILRVTRDDMQFFIDEITARKKIYHAPYFGLALPDNLDLEYIKSLSTKDRLEYLSDPEVLPQKCVGEYMKKLGQHLLEPTTTVRDFSKTYRHLL